jgi:hypothetical protein
LTLFVLALVVAIVLTVPDQPAYALGAELVVIAVVGGAAMLVLNRRAEKVSHQDPIARVLDRVGPNGTTIVLIAATGALTAVDVTWGIYLLVPAELAALVGGVISAWLFLIKISDTSPG